MDQPLSRIFRQSLCHLLGHKIERGRVWHDHANYRTCCRRCSNGLIRYNRGWKRYHSHIDHRIDRRPHPNYDMVKTKANGRHTLADYIGRFRFQIEVKRSG